ncbi:MAG: hypothetical protein OEX18_06015 [Candidatus Krumholzibacteria bacterium]|nr:hypothetical protein [Candidatus Krumholzibacteria bacterium]MDH4336818.1 hypothetical protein [Candidatus Krumholzibacteria bacterium]MDH5269415.1 hypothetical protein [Candidatus Krumholzibacteria bacterium]
MMRLKMILVMIVLLTAGSASASTWYVAAVGGDATTIQGGINLASNGDEVVVAMGTYTGPGNVNVSFNGKAILVRSESGPYQTVIDCQGAARGFTFINAEGPGSILEGFTIRNGMETKGGAILCDGASPVIRYNILSGNNATTSGGAIHIKQSSAAVYRNTMDGNGAPAGGAIALQGPATPQIYQNIVCNSTAGGALSCAGNFTGSLVGCNDFFMNTGGDTVCAGDTGSNFSLDPLFCGIPGSGNYYLQQTSPCVAAYSPCFQDLGALGIQCQVTATEQATWGKVKALYR